MKTNRLLVLLISIVFIASINFAFAADENMTQTISEVDDNAIELEETPQETLADNSNDAVVAADNSRIISDEVKTIVMGQVTKRYNGAIQYSASFYDLNGNPLKNTQVFFEVDDYNDYQSTTDSNGVALLTVLITKGNHKIAALNPVNNYIDSANIKVFDVITGGKDIKMYYDDGNVYKVRIFDDNGNPVKAGQKVTFTLNGKKYVRSTDKNGYASFKITATPGSYIIYAQYKDFKVGNYVTVKDVLKGKTGKGKVKQNSKIKFKVKFLGKKKKNKLIKVKFNKKTYKARTNKKGIATFKLKNPKKAGKFKVVVMYKKSKDYYTYTQW
jgi:hypothetical protein